MTHEQQADAICEAGHKAGAAILDAIDTAYDQRPVLAAR